MNARKLAVALCLCLLFQNVASAWDFDWVSQFGTTESDIAGGVAADSGGVYVAGSTVGVFPGQSAAGGIDLYLRKYGFNGAVLWTRQFGTPSDDDTLGPSGAVATDATGVYVGGTTDGTLPGQTNAGFGDAFVRKYSPAGDIMWTRQFGTAADDLISGVAVHSSGVYVAGYTSGTFPGAPTGSGTDVFIAKLAPETGNPVWVRQFGVRGSPTDLGGVDVDSTGVYVAGLHSTGDVNVPQAHLRRYDFDGNVIWARQLPNANGYFFALWSVSVHPTGVYITGQVQEGFFGEPARGGNGAAAHIVGLLRKYDVEGNELWTRKIKGKPEGGQGTAFTGGKRVRVSDAGVFVSSNLTGLFAGQFPVGSQSDTNECRTRFGRFYDQLDAYVRMYDFDGNVIWTRQFGSRRFDIALDLAPVGDSVYAIGDTACRIDPSQTLLGVRDAFLTRMTVDPTSLSGQTQLLVGRLETLSDAGTLGPQGFDSLVKYLEEALAALNQGNRPAAKQRLEAFIAEVRKLESSGGLPPSEAAALVAAADAVIAQL
ncbi:MAG TPA: hypothetical protein VN282_11350 [Pyrinomonadaceae bacterium]|nr:hypothetical protein [Pyrinomonadaceae bacterium]